MDLFKSLVWDILVDAALKQLFAAVPLLGWGPIGYVISWAVRYFGDQVYVMIKDFVNLELIAYRNIQFGKAYAAASVNLKMIAGQKGIESQEFKDARIENKKAMANVVKFELARKPA